MIEHHDSPLSTPPPEPCKHCTEQIRRDHYELDGNYVHITGPQRGKVICAIEPRGFHAEPVGTPCADHPANPCNGSRGIEPQIVMHDDAWQFTFDDIGRGV